MKVFIDNNVLIDFLMRREPFCEAATKVFGMCEQGIVEGIVSSLSIVNAAYVLRKLLPQEELYKKFSILLDYCHLSPISHGIVVRAIDEGKNDFEDAVQYQSAKEVGVDVILTRDKSGFQKSEIPVLTPAECVAYCEERQ